MFQFKTGDIILEHGTKLSNYVLMVRNWTWWNHVAVTYNHRYTSEMTFKNVVNRRTSGYLPKKIRVLRYVGLTEDQQWHLKESIIKSSNLLFDSWRMKLPIFDGPAKGYYWCNTYVEHVYKVGLNMNLDLKDMMRGNHEKYGFEVAYDYRHTSDNRVSNQLGSK